MENKIKTQFTDAGIKVQSVHQDDNFWHIILEDNTDCQVKTPEDVADMVQWIVEHPAPKEDSNV